MDVYWSDSAQCHNEYGQVMKNGSYSFINDSSNIFTK